MSKDKTTEEYVRDQRLIQEDYQKVFMRTKAGQRVLKDILSEAGVFDSCFTGNSHTFYKEGRRDIGLRILELLDKKTFAGLQMLESLDATDTDIFE